MQDFVRGKTAVDNDWVEKRRKGSHQLVPDKILKPPPHIFRAQSITRLLVTKSEDEGDIQIWNDDGEAWGLGV